MPPTRSAWWFGSRLAAQYETAREVLGFTDAERRAMLGETAATLLGIKR